MTSQTPETSTETPTSQPSLFHQIDSYLFTTDAEFQGGLRAILGSATNDPAQIAHLTLRAQCYYFARKFGVPVDFDAYKAWVENRRLSNGGEAAYDDALMEEPLLTVPSAYSAPTDPSPEQLVAGGTGGGGMGTAPHPASFAEICALIQEGKPIPGIKEIPDTILEGAGSEAVRERRRKPWERDGGAAVVDVGVGVGGEGRGEKLSWMT